MRRPPRLGSVSTHVTTAYQLIDGETDKMFTNLFVLVQNLRSDKKAVTALEYGLIAALVAVVIIGAVTTLGTNLSTTFATVASKL
jgi:pilus assembly protein Flp/PilA